jgi:uncharacterized protein (DUF1330 family)
MKKNPSKHIFSFLGLILFIILALGSQGEKSIQKDVATQAPTIRISARQLYADYEANEVAADQKYKGAILEVLGTVDTIGKDITNTIFVALKGDQYFGVVECMFSDEYAGAAARLKKGQTVTIKGRCEGKMINIIILRGCVLP